MCFPKNGYVIMNICVCGWYGVKYDPFYMILYKANKRHPVTVVAKRESRFWVEMALPYVVIENVGLEWGSYDYYLRNIWQSGDTLFTHDDVSIGHIIKDHKTVPMDGIFDAFAGIEADQAFIFGSRAEDVYNNGKHGRCLFISHKLLDWLKPQGFWFDKTNEGNSFSGNYNAGIQSFYDQMNQAREAGFDTLRKIYAPAYCMANRGEITNWEDLL